jgi:hypothetical protein
MAAGELEALPCRIVFPAELLREAESRGILLHEAFALADVRYWLQHIDWQTKFLKAMLAFARDPSRTTLRPLIELYGRDRERMRVEVAILARQLEHRLATVAQPDEALVRKAIMMNEKRMLAVYPHVRSGYGGADLARFSRCPGRPPTDGWTGSKACRRACVTSSWCSWTCRHRFWLRVRRMLAMLFAEQ